MLKLVDSEVPTPSIVRKSRSAHSALSSDASYYSEPEFDAASMVHEINMAIVDVKLLIFVEFFLFK